MLLTRCFYDEIKLAMVNCIDTKNTIRTVHQNIRVNRNHGDNFRITTIFL